MSSRKPFSEREGITPAAVPSPEEAPESLRYRLFQMLKKEYAYPVQAAQNLALSSLALKTAVVASTGPSRCN